MRDPFTMQCVVKIDLRESGKKPEVWSGCTNKGPQLRGRSGICKPRVGWERGSCPRLPPGRCGSALSQLESLIMRRKARARKWTSTQATAVSAESARANAGPEASSITSSQCRSIAFVG